MNFLLHMLKALGRDRVALRASGRARLRAAAAREAAEGHWLAALDNYRQLAETGGESAMDTLVRAQLHFQCHDFPKAAQFFAAGIDRLLAASDEQQTSVGQLVEQATVLLRRGRYARAQRSLAHGRVILDRVMAAEAGLILAQDEPLERLAALVRLSDLTLRQLARIHLAKHVAAAMEPQRLPTDLAPWATTANSVQNLLQSEQRRLTRLVAQTPSHAHWHFRLGVTARAANDHETAAAAFQQVLAIYPHHMSAAIGLAVTHERLGRPGDRQVLLRALRVPAETIRLFADFARTTADSRTFNQEAEKTYAAETHGAAVRGNLAMALSEMGLLDATRECWREPEPALEK